MVDEHTRQYNIRYDVGNKSLLANTRPWLDFRVSLVHTRYNRCT
jgi:hypothetical protein